MPRLISIIAALLAALFLATIVWAASEKGLIEGFGLVLAERWGVVGILDLYLGFLVIAGPFPHFPRGISPGRKIARKLGAFHARNAR